MYKMERLNVVRYAADERKKAKLEEQGFKEILEEDTGKQKRSATDGRDKA